MTVICKAGSVCAIKFVGVYIAVVYENQFTLGTHLIAGTIKCDFCDCKCIALLNTRSVVGILLYLVYRSESSLQLLVPAKCKGYQNLLNYVPTIKHVHMLAMYNALGNP